MNEMDRDSSVEDVVYDAAGLAASPQAMREVVCCHCQCGADTELHVISEERGGRRGGLEGMGKGALPLKPFRWESYDIWVSDELR